MRALSLLASLCLIAAAGCASDPSGPGGGEGGAGSGGSGAAPGIGGSGGMGGADGGSGGDGGEDLGFGGVPADEIDSGWAYVAPASLDDPLPDLERPASCGPEHGFFAGARGWIVAPGGDAISGAFAQLCVHTATGQFICLSPARSDFDGVYTVEIPEKVRCLDKVAMRVLDPSTNRGTVYCSIDPMAGPGVRLREPSVLPTARPALSLPPKGDVKAPREVVFDDGLAMQVTPSLFFSGGDVGYAGFGGRRIPTDAVGLCGEAPSFDGLYVLFPEGQIDAPGFELKIPNADGYPADAAVELFVLGGLDCQLLDGTQVPEASWAKFGEGRVSGDGAHIISEPGSGLPCFTWLAYRLKE